METVVESAPPKLSGLDLVRMTRGFSCVFWGLPTAMLFCIQLMISKIVVADPFIRANLNYLYFFLFFAMLGITCYGTLSLAQVEGVGQQWRRWSRLCLACGALSLYFSPFPYWWRELPTEVLYI